MPQGRGRPSAVANADERRMEAIALAREIAERCLALIALERGNGKAA